MKRGAGNCSKGVQLSGVNHWCNMLLTSLASDSDVSVLWSDLSALCSGISSLYIQSTTPAKFQITLHLLSQLILLLQLLLLLLQLTGCWSTGRDWPHRRCHLANNFRSCQIGWLGSWVVSMLDSGAEGPGFKSQPRRCRVTVLGKLFTPIVPLFAKQQNW